MNVEKMRQYNEGKRWRRHPLAPPLPPIEEIYESFQREVMGPIAEAIAREFDRATFHGKLEDR